MSVGVNIQELRGQFEIKNFEATCAVRSANRVEKQTYVTIQTPPLFGTEGEQFQLSVEFALKVVGSGDHQIVMPDPDKHIGLTLVVSSGVAIAPYVQLFATLVNVDQSKSHVVSFRSFRKLEGGIIAGWAPRFDPPSGLVPFKDVVNASMGWLHGGAVRFEVKLLLAIDDQTHTEKFSGSNPQKDVCADLGRLFRSGDMSDVVIKVKGEKLHAHSLILRARSSLFAAMLSSPMREGSKKEVTIQGLEVIAVRAALEFLYSGEVNSDIFKSDDDVLSTLEAAHRYGIQGLVDVCVEVLMSRLNVDVVAEWFYIADLIGCSEFRARCLEFIRLHISEVQATDTFAKFIAARPTLVTEILASVFPPTKRRRAD